MDMKSFYKKINVDNIKTKLPPIPHIPKLPKIKSRKIFKTSKEDLAKNSLQPQPPLQQPPAGAQLGLPPLSFIDRSPARISTIASLKDDYDGRRRCQGRYDYDDETDNTHPQSSSPPSGQEQRGQKSDLGGFTEKLTKHYKEFSEFKFKNLFGKKTVVRKTEIQVDMYAQRYREELEIEQEQERRFYARHTDADYNFQFKESRRVSNGSISPPDSIISGVPSPIRSELGELQRSSNAAPLTRRRNRQSDEESPNTRLSKWRFGSLITDSAEDVQHDSPAEVKPNRSAVGKLKSIRSRMTQKGESEEDQSKWSLRNLKFRSTVTEDGDDEESEPRPSIWKKKSGRVKSQTSDESPDRVWKIRTLMPKPVPSSTDSEHAGTDARSIWKMASFKRRSTDDADTEVSPSATKPAGSGSKLNLWKMKGLSLRSKSTAAIDEIGTKGTTTPETKELNVLRIWKMSMKRARTSASAEAVNELDDGTAQTKTGQLMERLKSLRGSKKTVTIDEAIRDNKKLSHMERFENARDKARQRVSNQMQKMNLFQDKVKPKEDEEEQEEPAAHRMAAENRQVSFIRNEPVDEYHHVPTSRRAPQPPSAAAIWASEQQFSQSFESDDFPNIPSVLIHQNSNGDMEPTLFISMIRPGSFSHPQLAELSDDSPGSQVTVKCLPKPPLDPMETVMSPIPQRAEMDLRVDPQFSPMHVSKLSPRRQSSAWIPNKQVIADFLSSSPSSQPKSSRGHSRKPSMDSNDSDSWIPENFRNLKTSPQTLNKIDEKYEAWRRPPISPLKEYVVPTPAVHRKSVDIFTGGEGESAFEDFDDELLDVPVLTIDKDTEEEAIKIVTKVQEKQEIAQMIPMLVVPSMDQSMSDEEDENEEEDEDDDDNDDDDEEDEDDQPPSEAPSPPPSFSPPPPPIPIRKPPPRLPERNDSMRNLPKPIIKQGSLRRQFSENLASDSFNFGSVNKLISRFEKQPSSSSDDSSHSDETAESRDTIEVVAVIESKAGTTNKTNPIPIPIPVEVLCEPPKDNEQLDITIPVITTTPSSNITALSHSARFKQRMTIRALAPPIDENQNPIGKLAPQSSSLIVEPQLKDRPAAKRNSTRDEDTFYSFDSDEETDNKFYSLGETGVVTSRRSYVIEF